ncbi:MAG TPA: hypothetical protein VNA69_09900 [Thermoanaerobaculia bacterium]|nr:hypothetical protein [Thermoanaerobaculia bacterium]
MPDTLSCAIPKVCDDGVLEIPRSAWAEIKQIADEEFGVTVTIHDHDKPGAYGGRSFVPFAHYLFEAEVEGFVLGRFISRMFPLIDALAERHTQQPTGR